MVSVIVPAYNVSDYLERCIESICGQTYKDLQIILVDDGSEDRSGEICDRYVGLDARIEVIHKANGGLVSARKAGLAAAQGEYIGFVDGDDWIEPQMYEHLVKLAEDYRADMVLGGNIEDVNGQITNRINRLKAGIYGKERLRKEVYPYMLCMENFFSMGIQPYIWNKLVRRSLAQECVMAVDERIRVGEDVAAVMPMLLKADKVVISDYCDYHYCIRGTSMMWKRENEESEWETICILHKFLRKTFSIYHEQYRLEKQLVYYTIMNMLTRAYGKVARQGDEGSLWPFDYHIGSGQCIVYSAGNFGRTLYGYLQTYDPGKVSLWVDRDYSRYQSMGLQVCKVEDIAKEQDSDILIALLDMCLVDVIKENLLRIGVQKERIYYLNIVKISQSVEL